MNGRNRPSAAEIYQTDLERHLFAPASRNGRPSGWLALDPVARWIGDWFATGWSRWKALAEAWDLS